MKKFFDPRDRSDADYQRDVDSGKIDAFRRSDAGGVYTYQTASDGSTIIKDVEPANSAKSHQQTDFIVRDGRITSMKSHND